MKMLNQLLLGILICTSFINCAHQENQSEWHLIYKNDEFGNSLYGDKESLVTAVRSGWPVRIGWGRRSTVDTTVTIEHVADAGFLSIINGQDVFAQIKTIVGQRPVIQGDSIRIYFREENHWVKIAGSNGFSTGMMSNYVIDSIINYNANNRSATSWYVLPGQLGTVQPLY